MDPVTLAILMGGTVGMGLLSSKQASDTRKSDLRLKAMETEMSPGSGLGVNQAVGPQSNPLLAAGQGALAGYQTGSNIEQSKLQKELMQKMMKTEQQRRLDSTWTQLGAPVIPFSEQLSMGMLG